MQENAGYTLDMAVTGSLEPHQAVVHHGTANEVVVARSTARCVMRTSSSDAATARVHSGDTADGSRLCIAPLQRQTSSRGGLGTATLQPQPASSTPISRNFSEQFSKIQVQVYHTQFFS